MLDPEQMGAEAFMSAATDIGVTFGTMDEKSIALAENLPKLADALNNQVIPAQDADEALSALIDDAADGDVVIGDIVTQFEKMPTPLGETATKGELAADMMARLGEKATDATGPLKDAAEYVSDLEVQIGKLDREVVLSFRYETTGTPPTGGGFQPPEYQHGGIVPGPPWQASLAWVHGQERITPAGHTTSTTSNSYGGDTYNVTINNEMAAAMFLDQQRRERFARINARM